MRKKLKENEFMISIILSTIIGVLIAVALTILIFISITEKNIVNIYLDSHERVLEDIAHTYDRNYEAILNFMNTIHDKKMTHLFLSDEEDDVLKSREYSFEMSQYFKDFRNIPSDLTLQVLLFSDHKIYHAFGDQRILDRKELEETITEFDFPDRYFSSKTIEQGFTKLTQNQSQLVLSRSLRDEEDNDYGKMLVFISYDDILNIYERFLNDHNYIFVFNNHKGEIFHSNHGIDHLDKYQNNKNYFLTRQKLEIPNMEITTIISRSQLINDVYRIKYLSFIIGILLLGLSFILSQLVRNITQPIYQLSKQLETAEHSFEKISLEGSYEIQVLVDAYNKMIDDLNQYIDDLLAMEKKKQASDFIALQRQISPHFIYNTLTSIRFLIINEENEKAEQALKDFIVLLRSLSNFDHQEVSLENEVEVLKHYISLQSLRFGPDIFVDLHVPEDLKTQRIPQLIIQPFIENALFHGFKNESGFISISFHPIDQDLIIEIMDNGQGIDKEKLLQIQEQMESEHPQNHIGIVNVHKRIQLRYGPEYGVKITSEPGIGTIVKINLPLT